MTDLERKKNVREGHRRVVTRNVAEADTIIGEIQAGVEVDLVKIARVKLTLKEKQATVKKLDEEITDLTQGAEEIVREIDDADKFHQDIYDRLARLEGYERESNVRGSQARAAASHNSTSSRAKLPKLQLPVFNGDVNNWTTFWDSFKVAVHENSDLTDIEKFNYLRSSVTSTAREAISGLTLTAANYQDAVKLLESRFGNKEKIISKHMEALLSVEQVTWQGNLQGLRALHDKVETHTRELKALGVMAEAYNSLLPPLLMKKLPNELCLIVSRKISEADWSLDNIMRELGEELKARERTEFARKRVGDSGREKMVRRSHDPPTGAALITHGHSNCCYCNETHSPESCKKIVAGEARKQLLRDTGRCFICLRRGHLSRGCRSSERCGICKAKHHTSICMKSYTDSGSTGNHRNKGQGGVTLNPGATPFKSPSLLTDVNGTVLLQTACATVYNPRDPGCTAIVRLIFDSGSQRTYVTERVRGSLNLGTIGRQDLNISTFGVENSKRQSCDMVKAFVHIRGAKDVALTLLTVPIICEPITVSRSAQDCVKDCEHLQDLQLADVIDGGEVVDIDILVGLDHYWDLITGEVIRGSECPIATYSKLGWLLSGPVNSSTTALISHVLTSGVKSTQQKGDLDNQLKKFWELEAIGIKDKESTLYDQFKQNVKFNGTRYEVTLPWRDTVMALPDNYELCLRRFKGLFRRLKQQPRLLSEYDRVIKEQLEKGIVEVIENPEVTDGDKLHYLPHHAVLRQNKETTKLRIVYDASARDSGPSLNDCLHIGPKFDQMILAILLRFRLFASAFTADVEKAFLMIGVDKRDRDALRFLWVEDTNEEIPRIQVIRFTRVAFGVASSPFLLNATIRNHAERFQESKPIVISKLIRSLYVDDVICGTSSSSDSQQCFEDFRDMLSEGGFNLRKLVGNGLADPDKDIADAMQSHKVLGILWEVDTDHFAIDLRDILTGSSDRAPTKRRVVSIASKIHYPLGFVSPVTINFKILFQELHVAKIGWDQEITGELRRKWMDMITGVERSRPIVISRRYFRRVNFIKNGQLCGFSDASTRAYAAVVYLRVSDGEDKRVSFVASKTRVAPVKGHTIPRLELLGALLLARLINSVKSALQVEIQLAPPVCYIDSQVSLYWIKGSNRDWKPFVENRVQEIRKLVPAEYWYHCSGADNPTDIPSRGLTPQSLVDNQLWFEGPKWLVEKDTQSAGQLLDMPCDCASELRAAERRECGLIISGTEVNAAIEIERFSSVDKLFRVTALVKKFVSILKRESVKTCVEYMTDAKLIFG